jgi:hypothetical protein
MQKILLFYSFLYLSINDLQCTYVVVGGNCFAFFVMIIQKLYHFLHMNLRIEMILLNDKIN